MLTKIGLFAFLAIFPLCSIFLFRSTENTGTGAATGVQNIGSVAGSDFGSGNADSGRTNLEKTENAETGKAMPNQKTAFKIYGYFPYWSDMKLSAIQQGTLRFDQFLHAFIWPGQSGKLVVPSGFSSSAFIKSVQEKWQSASISIGWSEGSEGFRDVVEDPVVQENFIADLASFIQKSGYDEINIDWEYPSGLERSRWLAVLANAIRKSIPNVKLSVSLPISLSVHDIDIESFEKSFDTILVMAYDLEDGGYGYVGFNAPLYKNAKMPMDIDIASLLESEYLEKSVPREKIILGIPLYGLRFEAPGPYADSSKNGATVEYKDLPLKYCNRQYDYESRVPFLSCNGYYISYDDQESIEAKMTYAKSKGLWWVYFWALWQDNNWLLDKLALPH